MKISKIDVVIILILLFIFHSLLFNNYLLANDLDYQFSDTIAKFFSPPFTWRDFLVSDGLGEFTTFTLWSWPYTLLYGLLSKAGMDFSLLVKLLGVIPSLLFGFYGMKKLCFLYGIKDWAYAIATLLYLTNTYILLLIDGGQIGLVLAYGLIPLIFVSYKKYFEVNSFKNLFPSIGLIIILSYFDIRMCFLIFLLILADGVQGLILSRNIRKIKSYLFAGGLSLVFLIGAHLFWIWPSIFTKSPQLPITYNRVSQVDFLSFANISHAFYLLQPHWPKNIFGKIDPIRPEFIFIPILVFLAPLLRKKDSILSFWLIISLISVLLIKGINEPFAQIYPWLFAHIPGFSFFRDPTKFFFLLALSYSVLVGFTAQEILNSSRIRPLVKKMFILTILLYLIVLTRPVFNNQTTGLFSKPENVPEYLNLASFIKNENNFSRILWIPKKPSLGYYSTPHPSLNAIDLASKRPFSAGVVGTYETLNFLREATYSGQLLGLAGVSHIVYPYLDPKRDEINTDNVVYHYQFLDQLSNLSWTNGRNKLVSVPTIDVKEYQDRFFIAPNIWWVIGSDDLYKKFVENSSLKLSKNALVFIEQYSGLGKRIEELKNIKIILNKKTSIDLAASFIDPESLMFPAKSLDFEPNVSGWWKREAADLVRWRDFLQNKYGLDNQDFDLGGGWAVAEGDRSLLVKEKKLEKNKMILARVMESSRSGELTFMQDEEIVGKINTKTNVKQEGNVRWFEVGKLFSNDNLIILTSGDINVINSLAILSTEDWNKYKDKGGELQKEGLVSNFDEGMLQSYATVQYKMINPTKYQVSIKNITQPSMLVFSENFDSLWKLDKKFSLPVYSFLNGFFIEKDGNYLLEFEPQLYVPVGVVLSLLSISLLVMFIIISRKKRR